MTNKVEKLFLHPGCFKHCFIYDSNVSIAADSENNVILAFTRYDYIYKYNTQSKLLNQSPVVHECALFEMDESKVNDLAYVRKYFETEERNLRVIPMGSSYYMLIKQNKKNTITDKTRHSFFIFDKELNQVNSTEFNHKINPLACFNYRKGILVFNDSLTNAYYYEHK